MTFPTSIRADISPFDGIRLVHASIQGKFLSYLKTSAHELYIILIFYLEVLKELVDMCKVGSSVRELCILRHKTTLYNLNILTTTVKSENIVSFLTLIGFFLYKSFWYGRPFFRSCENMGLDSGSR
jgi:hypothetical protein